MSEYLLTQQPIETNDCLIREIFVGPDCINGEKNVLHKSTPFKPQSMKEKHKTAQVSHIKMLVKLLKFHCLLFIRFLP